MRLNIRLNVQRALLIMSGVLLLSLMAIVSSASALTPIPEPDPKPGSYGLGATKTQDPPTTAATITTPGNGSSFNTSPITVSGICTADLLVQVYNNGVLVGSGMCQNGSFSLEIGLFSGVNELSAIMYDSLEQPGPVSNTVTINYSNTQFSAFGELVTLTSAYGRRSSSAGTQLSWPLQLSGGKGPYAFSLDWGDGASSELMSQSLAGLVSIGHTYKKAGIYRLNVRVVDSNNVTAFLQLVAVSSGQVDAAAATDGEDTAAAATQPKVLWVPAAVSVALLLPSYWLGRRSQIVSLRSKMLEDRDKYKTE